jgi:peptidoglycan/xylan/chitin deacetylase (PgdA/CDA1 family)
VVLTFHRVLNDVELEATASLPGMIVRTRTFDDFLAYATQNLEIVDAGHGPDWTKNSRLKVAITFDDGWCDNASEVFPVVRKHKAPITIFIVPRRIGSVLPFWPEQTAAVLGPGGDIAAVIERLKILPSSERKRFISRITENEKDTTSFKEVDRTMSWEQIEQLQAGGVVFGSHSSTHEILTRIPLTQAEEEIGSSRELIEQRLGLPCQAFAYPNGDSSSETRMLVAQAGYKRAFENQTPGLWTKKTNPFAIPRVNICEYHLVDKEGNFSPLIFDYAVVWAAAKCHFQNRLASAIQNFKQKLPGVDHTNALNAHGEKT